MNEKEASDRYHHRDRGMERKKLRWVTEGILVRVISTKVANGQLYEKKVKITHVLDQYSFEVVPVEMNSKLDPSYTDLREKDLETVLPKSKQVESGDSQLQIKIVGGEHRGRTGKVIELDRKRDLVVVQSDFCDLLNVTQDDCTLMY